MKRILALLALTGILLCGCSQAPEEEYETAPKMAEVVIATEAPEETEAPTEAPETEPATEATEHVVPEFQRHSGIREDGTFGEGALFIGDFLTYGLVTGFLTDRELLGDARYMIMCNAALPAFYYGPELSDDPGVLCSPEFDGLLFSEAILVAGEDTTAIYFMMGTNVSNYATDEMLVQVVEDMLIACPNATVYLQLVPFDNSTRVNHEEANRRIRAAYDYFSAEGNARVMLIDTQTAIGYKLTTEGIQLTTKGQACWYQALVAFADGNGIPQ